jgi:hypothetical protein
MIKLLITTALTYKGHHKYGDPNLIIKRENQYRQFIESMKIVKLDKYYCECVSMETKTFLNELVDEQHLFYSKTHNRNLKNIGVDEINACKASLDYFNFDDNDIVVKLTGRYFLNSMVFINEIIANENNFDVFYHPFPENHDGAGQMLTAAFGIRKLCYHNYLKQVDLQKMEKEMINVEYDMLNYLNINSDKIRLRPLDKLDITACSGNGEVIWQV